MNPTDELAYWITEREKMRERKDAGLPPPYSSDPIMAGTRFTNVMREDDKVTRWLKENWRDPHRHSQLLPTAMVLARMVNYIPTLEYIGYPSTWAPLHIVKMLKERAAAGEKVWSSAYLITTCGKRMDKENYVVEHVCDAVMPLNHRILDCETLQETYDLLRSVDGLGSFLAAQVVADLKHVSNLPIAQAPDWFSFSAPGPGSLKGLTAFWQRPITPTNYHEAISKAWELVEPKLPSKFLNLSMQDFQNCFCEYSKYVRIKAGGQARNRYHP